MTHVPEEISISNMIQELKTALDRDDNQDGEGYFGRLGINRCVAIQSLTHMSFGVPTLMMSVVGKKVITTEDQVFTARPGHIFILPEGVSFDVQNVPDQKKGRYLGLSIQFGPATMSMFRDLYGSRFDDWDLSPHWQVGANSKTIASVEAWITWIRRFPADQVQVRHRMVELLLLLAEQGIAGNLILTVHHSWRKRLRQLFILDPARPWRIADACHRLGSSESTLRRNLRVEETGFRELLEEVRLEHGIGLVMSTNMQITQISFACGYQSQSRFAQRFKLRFSMSPIELRNTRTSNFPSENISYLSLADSGEN